MYAKIWTTDHPLITGTLSMGVLLMLLIALCLRDAAPLHFVTVRNGVEEGCSRTLYILNIEEEQKIIDCRMIFTHTHLPSDGERTVTLKTAEAVCVSQLIHPIKLVSYHRACKWLV